MKTQPFEAIDLDEWEFIENSSALGFARSLELVGLDAAPIDAQCIAVDGLYIADGSVSSSYPEVFYLSTEDEDRIDLGALVLAVKAAINRQRKMCGHLPLFEGVPNEVHYYKPEKSR